MKKTFEELQTQMVKATAVLKNLQWCIDNQMEDVDVMSSLDVLNDYMEDQLMEMVGGSESNVWKLYESIMCVYFDMEEIIKQAVYLQGAYDRERMLK